MRLRDVELGDVAAYVRMRCDPVMMAELGGPLPREGIEDKVARDVQAAAVGTGWIKMIVPGEAAPEVVAGSVALWSHDEDGGEPVSEIGWMVLPVRSVAPPVFIRDEFGPEVTSYMRRQAGLKAENRMGAAESVNIYTGDGRLLEALVSGPPDGTVLVLHTGTPCGLVPLPAGLDPAPMGIRTVLYARPGYGRSTPQAGRTVADAAGDTAAILDALGTAKFLNLGWSGGGPYALACDALLADRCLATAVIAGTAPYTEAEASSPVRAWYEADEDNQLAFAGDIEGFRQAVDAFVAQLAEAKAENIAAETNSDADRRFFSQGYAEWVASFLRAGGVSGSQGAADDCLAALRDWGFPLANIRQVTIWQGTEDQHVPPFHAEWLRDHLPKAELRTLESEGHNSIAGRLPEIINTLIATSQSAQN